MNELNGNISNLEEFERERRLREDAEVQEAKEKVRQKLLQLIEISEDPYYDQYLNQMLKDLESGKATPFQVSKEADRTYRIYRQRMGINTAGSEPRENVITKDTMEFKVGAGIFSIVGAVFVLASIVILGFNFLEGIWQGVCLYAASGIIILLSELLVKRLSNKFSLVITGIGISSLYISTIVNYLVLKNMNGIAASIITVLIALFSILLSRKKDAASIRMISFLGCYICFLPIRGFESELDFLIMTGMVLIINIVSIFLPNQKNSMVINLVHLIAHTMFTGIVIAIVTVDGMNAMYLSFFIVTSLVLINAIYLRHKEKEELLMTLLYTIALGFMVLFLIGSSCFPHGISDERILLFNRLLAEVMAAVVSVVFFILWGQDRRRWIQYYFIAALITMINGFSDYRIETTIACIAAFALTRLLYKVEELKILDCILAVVTVLQGLYMCRTGYVIPFAVVLFLSAFLIRRTVIFHEIVLTTGFLIGILIQFDSNWTLPGCVGALFVFFLLFNHLPVLKNEKQLAYNIVNVVFAGLFCFCTVFCWEYYINAVTMLIGTVMFLMIFRKKYGLELPKKYLFLAGYLIYMIFASNYETPVIVSILLMTVAVGCVGIGIVLKDKVYRICGLVISVIVCVKMLIYDFRELESMPRAVLFMIVGVIALVISFLYIYQEKKEDQEEDSELKEPEIEVRETDTEERESEIEVEIEEKETALQEENKDCENRGEE
ncbi:MAG: DUF2339 domain-containing protein [Lachnospiraceae bacterium]|nr:DUF2339 domain-containing protein [Lachnospiraceae bacterium]